MSGIDVFQRASPLDRHGSPPTLLGRNGRFDSIGNLTVTPKRAPRLKWQVHGVWHSADKIEGHNIPARPFMHLQASDVDWMVKRMDETVGNHFRKHGVAW